MKRFPLWAAACLLGATLPALAEDDVPPQQSRFFETFDKDGDGRVTREEFSGDAEVFRLLDQDQDGVITPTDLGLPADFKPAPRSRAPGAGDAQPGATDRPRAGRDRAEALRRRLAEMDTNGDGKVSRDEFRGPADVFQRFDRNGDGVLDGQDAAEADDQQPGAGQPGAGGRGGNRMREEMLARLKAMDKDGDGKVSPEEYDGPFPFERLDRNQDGFLDEQDMQAGGRGAPGAGGAPRFSPEQMEARFKELDKNGDGKLGKDEFPRPEFFDRLDQDGDGQVTLDEFRGAFRRGRGGEGRPGDDGAGAPPRGLSEQALRRFDTNRDGKVTRDEFPGSDERFQELDRNKDGVLTDADREAAAPAPAAPTTPPVAGPIAQFDKDANGKLSRDEWKGSDEEWRRLDKNQDGWITRDETGEPPPGK